MCVVLVLKLLLSIIHKLKYKQNFLSIHAKQNLLQSVPKNTKYTGRPKMYLPSLNSFFSGMSDYNLKKICSHTVVLKSFVFFFCTRATQRTLEEHKSSIEYKIFPFQVISSKARYKTMQWDYKRLLELRANTFHTS